MIIWKGTRIIGCATRCFSTSSRRTEIRHLSELPERVQPTFKETSNHDLLSLRWPSPPRNILVVRKDNDDDALEAVLEFGHHIRSTYPDISLIFEPYVAEELHRNFDFPIYAANGKENAAYQEKVDLTSTFGGDGTILHAASLFATAQSVPPILSFSMGTLGFLGEWRVGEYKRAFRQAYVSGAPGPLHAKSTDDPDHTSNPLRPGALQAWSNIKGKSMGHTRNSRILMRNRLRVGLFDENGTRLPHGPPSAYTNNPGEDVFALNEVLLHRGSLPHLAHITILIGSPPHQRTLTTAIADGFLISTPTGSTAYSLSSGGSIVHPLVSSLLLTPICPRSLSFRPLVLPANTPITLRIDEENRGKEIEVSVDGARRQTGLKTGMEVRVVGEEVRSPGAPGSREWAGGVPSIVRSGGAADGEDHWVGGLNSMLKFNYPFGNG
ncbi:ATP-NAD kinase-like domain-containing protein [Neohortaea acidophila]|uniref:ATP-NAD kinase-like domain-containing protein n=1 Tax=Neohortaea acidophila TaxID=245834 RepID=A0A6A6PWZ8_9PEZI|nr:ATP-NAD kinase-like domain-containing protein [Neohortaea acidophila]KAF2484562.1 ATP-NAD kinase-like domain-containing protein [Neohortaea acidophila]